ncbi:MAG TPA: ABC transporter permease [Chryseolinea sp.]|nr:ABC transporter permease [Chryseolinea sp.]
MLNILGLSLGIAVSLLLLLILQSDLTYDRHYEKHAQIFRVGCDYFIPGMEFKSAQSARELGYVLKTEYPEVTDLTKIDQLERGLVEHQRNGKNEMRYEENLVQSDARYFKIFSHSFLTGNPETCLDDLNSVVITRSVSLRYFGSVDVVDRILVINGTPRTITAVIENHPDNTHLKFDFLLSGLSDFRDWAVENGKPTSEAFWNPDVMIYALLPENYVPSDFHAKFKATYERYFKTTGDQVGGRYSPILQPLAETHFDSTMEDDRPQANISYLIAFTVIGILIFFMACINYVNLSTAKSVSRAPEIALKKVVGSSRRTLIVSILTESMVLSIISLLVAIFLVYFVLNGTGFNLLIGKNLSVDFIGNPMLLAGSLIITLVIGLLSGIYPALFLSKIPVITALKGSYKDKKSSLVFRKALIAIQFAVSIFVVVCSLSMQHQIDFIRNKDLGFKKDNILVLPIPDSTVRKHVPVLKNELLKNTGIESITTSDGLVGTGVGSGVMFGETNSGMQQRGGICMLTVGEDFLSTMNLTLVSGRDFKLGSDTDLEGVYIANETAVEEMQLGTNPLGKKISFFHGQNLGTVIGIVKDFNSSSLHHKPEPLLLLKENRFSQFVYVRVTGENLPQTISSVQKAWTQLIPNRPFEYFFLDQRFNELYKADETQIKLLNTLSYTCVFISLLGLLGLSAFSASQRTKEIGVRKVLGATIPNIILLLSKEVILLVLAAAVIVAPLCYWLFLHWIERFAYKTDFNYLLFVIVTLSVVIFVASIVTLQSLRVASLNPAKSLKHE